MDNALETSGAFSWNELLTSDPSAARQFYGALFGWQFDEMPSVQGVYHVVKLADGTAIGGIMQNPLTAQNVPPHWGPYVTVDNVDLTAAQATALGGRILVPPTDIPKVGRFALLQDPQGATIAAIAYAMSE
jgi:hypothetical protein